MTTPPPDKPPAAERRAKHQCPDCGADCYCRRGTLNPKDCIHMECFSGVHDEECDGPSGKESNL